MSAFLSLSQFVTELSKLQTALYDSPWLGSRSPYHVNKYIWEVAKTNNIVCVTFAYIGLHHWPPLVMPRSLLSFDWAVLFTSSNVNLQHSQAQFEFDTKPHQCNCASTREMCYCLQCLVLEESRCPGGSSRTNLIVLVLGPKILVLVLIDLKSEDHRVLKIFKDFAFCKLSVMYNHDWLWRP